MNDMPDSLGQRASRDSSGALGLGLSDSGSTVSGGGGRGPTTWDSERGTHERMGWVYVCGGDGKDAIFGGSLASVHGGPGYDRAEITMCGAQAVVFKVEQVQAWPPDYTCK